MSEVTEVKVAVVRKVAYRKGDVVAFCGGTGRIVRLEQQFGPNGGGVHFYAVIETAPEVTVRRSVNSISPVKE